jgi:Xaa-Pro aminopeptidase
MTKKKQYLFTDGRYSEAVRRDMPDFTLVETTSLTPFLTNVEKLITKLNLEDIGIEIDDLRVSEYKSLSPLFRKKRAVTLGKLREKKDGQEIAAIKKACQIGDKTYTYMLKRLQKDQSEKQIAAEMEYVMKRQNAEPSFRTIVATGKNAAIPHHSTSEKKIQNNQFLLFDFGVRYNYYCSDMTRTVVIGKATEQQKKIYHTVLNAQQKAIEYIEKTLLVNKPVKAGAADTAAREYIESEGFPTIPHSLGHGIGIDVHELPRLSPSSKSILSEGMVFSIEPGIYLPEIGGVRIEDLFTIQNNKLIQLTKAPKKELMEIAE